MLSTEAGGGGDHFVPQSIDVCTLMYYNMYHHLLFLILVNQLKMVTF